MYLIRACDLLSAWEVIGVIMRDSLFNAPENHGINSACWRHFHTLFLTLPRQHLILIIISTTPFFERNRHSTPMVLGLTNGISGTRVNHLEALLWIGSRMVLTAVVF